MFAWRFGGSTEMGAPPGDRSPYLRVLGPLRLWRGGTELDPGPRQQAYLLALPLARDRVAGWLLGVAA
jgi:hypothetical protein